MKTFRSTLWLLLLAVSSFAQTHTEVTIEDAQTITGAKTITQLNGCQYVHASQTFAAAVTAVGTTGCLWISPGTYSVSANATIPIGVTLLVDQGATLSVANAVTLTINGPIQAGPYQIFSYTGTGTVALGSGTGPIHAIWWPGADFHAQMQNAYTSLPTAPSAGIILLDPNPAGGCWTTTTTAKLNTSEKYAFLQASTPVSPNIPQKGFCDNFTPTIVGSSFTISAVSDAANLLTFTCSTTCTTGWTGGGGSTATLVEVDGVTNPDYNGVYLVQTVSDGTHFTANASIGTPGASSGGTVAQPAVAVELDWTPAGGGGYDPSSGMYGFVIDNNGCSSNGGCGNKSIGILLSRTNAGLHAAFVQNTSVHGFGIGIAKVNSTNCQTGWGDTWSNNSLMWNNTGMFIGCANENDNWWNGRIAVNGTGVALHSFGAELTMSGGGSLDSNTTTGVNLAHGAILHTTSLHWENLGVSTCQYVTSQGTSSLSELDIVGGISYDDSSVGNCATPRYSAGLINVNGLSLHTNGRGTTTQVFNSATACTVNISTVWGSTIAYTSLLSSPTTCNMTLTGNGSPSRSIASPLFIIPQTGATPSGWGIPGQTSFYCDSTANICRFNNNNGANIQNLPQTFIVTSAYTNATTTFSTITFTPTLPSILANVNYTLNCNFTWQGSATTTGPKFQITGPASPTNVAINLQSAVTATTSIYAVATGLSTAVANTGTIANAVNLPANLAAGIQNGANAGAIAIQAAANGAGTLTIQPGSYCVLQ